MNKAKGYVSAITDIVLGLLLAIGPWTIFKTCSTAEKVMKCYYSCRAVLIIGILAAIALPKYKKAVERSRFTQLITYNNAIVKAQQIYYLANGEYAMDLRKLDIGLPSIKGMHCFMQGKQSNPYTACSLQKRGKGFVVLEEVLKTGQFDCCSYRETNFAADDLCITETGAQPKPDPETKDYKCFTRVK